jgi:hypothetical protein
MQRRFGTLRVISSLIKFAATLLGLFSFIGFAFSLYVAVSRPVEWYPTNVPNGYTWVLLTGAVGLFIGVFLALLMYGVGSLIEVLLAIEENTRMSARETRRMVQEARRRELPPAPQPKSQPIRTPRPDSQAIRSLPPQPSTRPISSQSTAPLPSFNRPNPPPVIPEPPFDDDEPDFRQK